jgi:predicted Zn-dependent protease
VPPRGFVGWRQALLCGLAALAVQAGGCGLPPPDVAFGAGGEGPGHRQQKLALSPEEEWQVGTEAYQKVLGQYRDRLVPGNSPAAVRTRNVLRKLVQAVQIEPLQREINLHIQGYKFAWKVNLVKKQEVNAFCLPAGYMIVYTGLLKVVEDDDQMATVLGHEMAHALAHHASERVAREQQTGGGALGILGSLSFNRRQESEADHIGLFLMTFAGYDPREAVRFWQRMKQVTGAQGRPEILSDHPSDEHRIEMMERWVSLALAGKRAFDEGRIAR